MLSILHLELPAEEVRAQPEPAPPEPSPVAPEESPASLETPEEFEIVLGRRQAAGVLFVASVVVVVFSAVSYLAGRALVTEPFTGDAVSQAPVSTTVPEPAPTPVPEATVVKAADAPLAPPAAAVDNSGPAKDAAEAPMFANPVPKAVYLQMGAVEKGVAVIMVEGLRKRGFSAFAAPGPTETVFRVLIGPLDDGEAFVRTKERVDRIGLNSFVRKYQP